MSKAEQALNRMADNAKELGLDYEPAQKETAPLRDAIVANLVREGINKHKARELADHFIGLATAQQKPVELFKWLPEGATHIGRISVRTAAGGSLAMTTHAFKYEGAVLKVYITDNDNEYPGWRDAKDCFFHLNFPVLPLYTSPQPAQQEPVAWMSDRAVGFRKSEFGATPTVPLYTSPPAQPAVPDALTIADKESADYHEGWNDCRALMLEMRKP